MQLPKAHKTMHLLDWFSYRNPHRFSENESEQQIKGQLGLFSQFWPSLLSVIIGVLKLIDTHQKCESEIQQHGYISTDSTWNI